MITDTEGIAKIIPKEEFRMFATISFATDNVSAGFSYSSYVGKSSKSIMFTNNF